MLLASGVGPELGRILDATEIGPKGGGVGYCGLWRGTYVQLLT